MARLGLLLLLLLSLLFLASPKSTIEPCSGSDSCNALVGYTLYADLKLSEVAALFQADPVAIVTANAMDISVPDVENHILPSGLFLRVPVVCSCANGIRKSISTRYKARPSDTLASVATSVYAGLVSADQIREANSLPDPAMLDAGQTVVVPLPCTCFNSTDNNVPTVYLSYVVQPGDTVPGIATRYVTTITDIMSVNAMGSPTVTAGDIIAIPLPACVSRFARHASDYGLIVANGSYAITASHCVQCSCGPGNLNLYCTPVSLALSCLSMQCRNSNLMLGNFTARSTSAGCNFTSCTYGGFVNGTILTMLSTSLQPKCPGQHQFPPLVLPPSALPHDSFLSPSLSPMPSPSGGAQMPLKTPVSGTFTLPSVSPVNGPSRSTSGSPSIVGLLSYLKELVVLFLLAIFVL